MKNITTIVTTGATVFLLSTAANAAATDPTSLKIKVYKWAVSKNADCSEPITVFNSPSPTEVDFMAAPTLGTGILDKGIYPCVVIEMSDNIKAVPKASEGSYCVAGTEFTYDICQSGTARQVDGTNVTCTAIEDKVGVWISTLSQETGSHATYDAAAPDDNSAFLPPTLDKTYRGFKMTKSFTVNGSADVTFTVNFLGKIASESTACGVSAPKFSFD